MKAPLKSLYKYLPFKKFAFILLRRFWIPSKGIYKHLHFFGVFTVRPAADKRFLLYNHNSEIENDIFWEGLDHCWEKVSLKLWINLCKDAKVIFDVGAYTGIYSLIAKCLNPQSQIYTFEPSDDTYDKLVRNCKVNNYDIHFEHLGVSAKNGKVEIDGIYQENKYVESVSLDSYIAKHKIEHLDLIKIDVERHEPQVLEGFKISLKYFRPTMLIESLTDEIGKTIQEYVRDLGYLYFNIDEDGGVRQVQEIRKSDYYNYLLCNEKVAKQLGLIS